MYTRNKSFKAFSSALCLALALSVTLSFPGLVFAATSSATTVESTSQGLKKNGSAVDVSRSDATKALGAADGDFYSLGFGGEIVLGFPSLVGSDLVVSLKELTGGSYPLETADVYVSADGSNFAYIGEATNESGQGDGITEFDLLQSCIQYVKVIDTTDSSLHSSNADAFDIDAIEAVYTEECETPEEENDPMKVFVSNKNKAKVINFVDADSNTGGNTAGGSTAGDGGNGGNIDNDGDDVEDSNTGDGGRGGDSGLGGTVITGNATSRALATNTVNTNITRVGGCDCKSSTSVVKVRNRSRAKVKNFVGAGANTGLNEADGSTAGDGGNGGNIDNDDGDDVEESTTGNGGAGGDSSAGAYIETGRAVSEASASTRVNTSRTRVR